MKSPALAAAFALIAGAAMADGISGTFRTQPNDQGQAGLVEFYDCGGKYCGKLIKSFDKAGAELKTKNTGKNIVANMTDNGGGSFSGGTIWDPGADRTYRSKMVLSGNTLKVSGCIAVFCRTQTWTRAR
ncbi:DUF2147 domain-containing protein [Paracoccus limosus]|jgi:uncharacterized protein (DUF2147 family)|uniref:DUF2147 domain-containing protein n=1 Tax=Paracoccus limosus TaxID=913252 RepID=A0A844H0N0_9RHOB|nr:DUF2147 domain-containing protein [Paracoccus limosus]MTH33104.1 DUF2147 domain-containing protein [Paracoccus limosus]